MKIRVTLAIFSDVHLPFILRLCLSSNESISDIPEILRVLDIFH